MGGQRDSANKLLHGSLFAKSQLLMSIFALLTFASLSNATSVADDNSYPFNEALKIMMTMAVNIREDAPVGQVLATFYASSDSMTASNKSFTFQIARESDPKRQFTISQSGQLRVAQPLDHSKLRSENRGFGHSTAQWIRIDLSDVNDNAPELYTVPDPCIFLENTDPNAQTPCEIFGRDADTLKNGPPFKMQIGPSYPYASMLRITFNPNGDGGNGSMAVRPLIRFDRENPVTGKILRLPIIVADSGSNTQQATRIVLVVIGDDEMIKSYGEQMP